MLSEKMGEDFQKALQSAIGTSSYGNLHQLTSGLSNAQVYRIGVRGKSNLLKIARTVTLNDPMMYYYSCMKSAAEAGLDTVNRFLYS